MAKRAHESHVQAETTEGVMEKAKSQVATIEDLERKLKRQADDCRDLSALYTSRYHRLQGRYRALKDRSEEEAAIASLNHRREMNILRIQLKDAEKSSQEDCKSLQRAERHNECLLGQREDLSNAVGRYMDNIAKWKTHAQDLKDVNDRYEKDLEDAQEENRDLRDARFENKELRKELSQGIHSFLTAKRLVVQSEPFENNFSTHHSEEEHHAKRRRS